MTYDCIPCAIGSLLNLFKKGIIPKAQQDATIRALLKFLSDIDLNQSPPALGREMHQLIRDVLDDPDPYLPLKEHYNRLLLDKYSIFKHEVENSSDPFQLALRLAIAGNIIDFGPNHDFDVEATISKAKHVKLSIDHSAQLRNDLSKAETVLYLGDNAGEIVLDRLFLETINHRNVYFAVRGGPIINDVTETDARQVGIDKLAQILSSGDTAPGIILENVDENFESFFTNSDLIISKGQGNYEGLSGTQQNIYFMLMAKCDHVAEHLGVSKGDMVIVNEHYEK